MYVSPFPIRVFSYYGKLANVTALESMLLDPYRRIQSKKAIVVEPVEQSESKDERRVSESSIKDIPGLDKKELPEEDLRSDGSKSSRVAEAKTSSRNDEPVPDTAVEKKSADRVSPRSIVNLTQPIPSAQSSPRNQSEDGDDRPRGSECIIIDCKYFHSFILLNVMCSSGSARISRQEP